MLASVDLASLSDVRPQPYRPPAVASASIPLHQAMRGGRSWPIPDADADAEWGAFELRLMTRGSGGDDPLESEPAHSPSNVRLSTPHGDLHLPDDELIHLVTGIPMPPIADPHRTGVLAMALAHWPKSLLDAFGGSIGASGACGTSGEPDGEAISGSGEQLAVLTLVGRDGARHSLTLRASVATLLACVSMPGWHPLPAGPLPTAVAAIPLVGGLGLGSIRLTLDRLHSLRRGDALWLPADAGGSHAPISLVTASGIVHLGQIDCFSYEFQGWGPSGGAISNPHQAFPPSLEPRKVDALTVDLDFIVGRLSMTVGELSALSKGQIVPLDALTPAQVRIVAHGTELGRGRLVEIEGRLAVEIDEWSATR